MTTTTTTAGRGAAVCKVTIGAGLVAALDAGGVDTEATYPPVCESTFLVPPNQAGYVLLLPFGYAGAKGTGNSTEGQVKLLLVAGYGFWLGTRASVAGAELVRDSLSFAMKVGGWLIYNPGVADIIVTYILNRGLHGESPRQVVVDEFTITSPRTI
jgi:hypothetical protein